MHSVGEAMEVQRRGARARQKAGTALNYSSSRSHSIFTISMFASDAAPADDREVRVHPSRLLPLNSIYTSNLGICCCKTNC